MTEIRTGGLMNMSLEYYRYTSPFGGLVSPIYSTYSSHAIVVVEFVATLRILTHRLLFRLREYGLISYFECYSLLKPSRLV
jgi:hypothetical protein